MTFLKSSHDLRKVINTTSIKWHIHSRGERMDQNVGLEIGEWSYVMVPLSIPHEMEY